MATMVEVAFEKLQKTAMRVKRERDVYEKYLGKMRELMAEWARELEEASRGE